MATRRLTVNLFDFTDNAVSVPVIVQLDAATTAPEDAPLPARFIVPHSITRHTNEQGVAVFDLEPSQNLAGNPQYRVSWTGGAHAGYLFAMPDADTTLYRLVAQPFVPPPAASLPLTLTDGDVVIGQNGAYELRKVLHAANTPPANPARTALWWDTSVDPADPRYTVDGGTTWNELRDPADMAAALNSLTGPDRLQGAHISGQVVPPIGTALPATTGYRPGSFFIVQASGQTATAALNVLTGDQQVAVGNQNRLQFTITGNVISASTDNYENILGSIHIRTVGQDTVVTIRLDTGVGTEAPPDQLWIRGLEPANALSEFRVDLAQPYTYSGGRRYKQLNNVVSAALSASGISGPQTWLLFTDLGGTQGYDFKPPVLTIPGEWVEIMGGSGGGGLSTSQVQSLIRSGVADWAEQGNTDVIPSGKLASGGTTGQVLKRTATAQEWAADAGGLDQAAVDARVAAGVKDFAETGGRTIQEGDIANNAITADKIATGAVGGTEIAPDSVGTSELANNAVTNAKMANNAVGQAEIAANSVGSSEIQNNAVGSSEIAANAVGSSEIATNAVTSNEIANQTIVDGNLSTATQGRLLPAGGTDGQILTKASGTDYDADWENAPAVPTGGLDQAAVDARVRAGVKDYAEQGNTADKIPVGDLASAVTDRFVPAGGATNQVLSKSSATDYDTQWVAAATGGAGTPLTVTPRSSTFTPSLASTALTPGTEVQVDIAVGTVAANHPLSVTSNGIVVTTGTDPFVGTIQTKLAVDPTAWTNSANAGGNRLFIQSYWKKDGTIVEATRQDYYIRGDERYAPTEHLIVADATLELTAGTYTLFINKIGQAAAGNEINSIQINATSSNITLVSADYSGGDVMTGGGGLDQAAVDARVTAGTKVFARAGGRNVRGGDIDSDTITAANLAPNSVGASELADDAVDSGAIADDAVTQAKIANDAVGADQLAANSVGSSEIVTNAVTATEIANQTIVAGNIANDAVGNAQIATDAVRADQIQAGAVGSSEIAANAVGASELADNAVDSGAIANLAVTEAKLASNAVSERTIQDDAVRAAQIQAGAVGTSELANDAVTAAKIDTDAVGSAEIAAGAVGTSELANNAVTPAQVHSTLASRLVPAGGTTGQILAKASNTDYDDQWINAPSGGGGLTQSQVDGRVQALVEDYAEVGVAGTIPTARLADNAVTQAKIASNAVGASELADNAVDAGAIATGAVTRAKLGTGAVGSGQLGDNSVVTGKVSNLAITEAKLASNAVSERTIQDDAVRAAQIQAGAVGTSELANNAVQTAKIGDNQVTAAKLDDTTEGRLIPSGGTDNQILAKASGTDYDTEWVNAPTGAGSSTFLGLTDTPNAYVAGQFLRQTATGIESVAAPTGAATPLVVTALESSFTPSLPATNVAAIGETQINIAAGTIASAHPFSVSNNGIVVAAGTTSFQATFDVVVEVDPTGYVNNATAGGNRLFFDIYLKKDGVIIPASRTSQYMRAHEGWAATIHKAHLTFTDALSPGTYTLWFYRGVAAGSGNEVNAIQIASTNSTIIINSETYGGQPAPGSGLTQAQTDARVNALVADFAEQGNASLIPVGKLAAGGTAGQILTRTATAQEWAAAPVGSKFFVKRAYSTTGTQRTLAISATEDGVTWSDYHAITLTFSVGSVEYNTTIPIGGLSVRTGLSTFVIVDEYFEWSGTTRTLRARNLNGLIRAAYLVRY